MRNDSITVTTEINIVSIGDELWSGARDRWNDADLETQEAVWNRIQDYCECMEGEPVSMTTINDLVWFDCDDLFYPETDDESEDESEDELESLAV